MKKMHIGIDPGINGAAAIITNEGVLVDAFHMPTLMEDGKKKIDSEGLMMSLIDSTDLDVVLAIEKVHAMPNQGVTSVFSFGETYGRICGAIHCSGISSDLIRISPRVWKKHYGLTSDKNESLELARELFPDAEHLLKRKKDADIAEALLIAKYSIGG